MYMHLQILVSDTKLDSKCNLQNKETCQIPLSFWVSEIETEIEFWVLKLQTLWSTQTICLKFDVWIIWFNLDDMW